MENHRSGVNCKLGSADNGSDVGRLGDWNWDRYALEFVFALVLVLELYVPELVLQVGRGCT